LLIREEPESFERGYPDKKITRWLARQLKKIESNPSAAAAINDPQPFNAAISARHENLVAVLLELELWLRDMVRNGLAILPGKPKTYWLNMANRLIDAQAGQIARELKYLANVPGRRSDWPDHLLAAVGRLYLLIQGFKHFDTLSPEIQSDLRTAVGWLPRQHALPTEPVSAGRWLVMGRRLEKYGKHLLRRTWLWGLNSEKPLLIAEVLNKENAFEINFATGTILHASVQYYPGQWPLHGLMTDVRRVTGNQSARLGHDTIMSATRQFALARSANPWQRVYPMAFEGLYPEFHEGEWRLRDDEGVLLPFEPGFAYGWHLLALSGGHPLRLFGEWDGTYFQPLSVFTGDSWLDLHILRGIK
jgi:hypothetical protein